LGLLELSNFIKAEDFCLVMHGHWERVVELGQQIEQVELLKEANKEPHVEVLENQVRRTEALMVF